MRKSVAVLAILFLLRPSSPTLAADSREDRLARNLRVNRLLLAQYSKELGGLRRRERGLMSRTGQARLMGLGYKIEALLEDRKRLKSHLPMTVQADTFLIQFVRRHGKPPLPPRSLAPSPQAQNTRLHEEALAFVADRNMNEAAKRYEEIVLGDPDDDEAYLLLGHVYLMSGRYDQSEFAYYNAVHIDRSNYDEIIPFYQNLVVQNPDDESYLYLGYAYVILSDGIKAKDAFEEALRINPANFEARKGLALISQRFGV